MEYTTLSETGVRMGRLGFGGAPAGLKNYLEIYDPEDRNQRSEQLAAIRRALELGVTYFDTAPGYGGGASELIFREGLAGCSEAVFLATKVSHRNRDGVRGSIAGSLERLGRGRLDLVQIHGSSYDVALTDEILRPGGMLDELEGLREKGVIRFLGFTSEDTNDSVYRLIRTRQFDMMQICYNLIYQHPHEPNRPFGSILEADRARMGVVTMRTMTSGILQDLIQTMNPENTFDYTPGLLQFVLSNPLVDVALVGMRDVETVEKNVAIVEDQKGRIALDRLHERYVDR